MMIKNIDHIGIAVKSLDDSLPLYTETLKLELEGIETVESQGVKVAFIMAGNTRLELLEALSPESPIAKFIEKRGEGIHHVALGVDDIEARIEELKQSGLRMIDNTSRKERTQRMLLSFTPNLLQVYYTSSVNKHHRRRSKDDRRHLWSDQ